MRLLRIHDSTEGRPSLSFETFEGDQIPPYAILSHRWEEGEEVLFADILDGTADEKKGYNKIEDAANQARQDDLHYVWVDTCCIDKSSSAELSEAINSMFTWYESARICYAYLADVAINIETSSEHSEFARSQWWKRGWTLQELLAPKRLRFYSREWLLIGEKHSLAQEINKITGIEIGVLTHRLALEGISVAKRMSWAASRKTTRIEDTAYCLMGLFSVNMPLLYGEGMKAFQRLQEEIMKNSDDHSLFAWVDKNMPDDQMHGLFADSPAAFADSRMMAYSDYGVRTPFEMTNRGLRIDLHLTDLGNDIYLAALNCPEPTFDYRHFVAIYLKKLDEINNQFVRILCARLGAVSSIGVSAETVFVRQRIPDVGDELRLIPEQTMFLVFRHNVAATTSYRFLDMICTPVPSLLKQYVPATDSKDYRVVREWLPRDYPQACETLRGPKRLAVAILLQREVDEENIAVLFGTIASDQIGFDAIEVSEDRLLTMEQLQPHFTPHPIDSTLKLPHHHVSIQATKRNLVTYTIDINIKSTVKDAERPGMRARATSLTVMAGNYIRGLTPIGRKSDANNNDVEPHEEHPEEQ